MMRIRYRFTLIFTLVIGIIVLGLSIFITNLIEDIYIDAVESRLKPEAKALTSFISKGIKLEEGNELTRTISEIGNDLQTRMTVIALNGKVIADSEYEYHLMENHRNRPEIKKALLGEIGKEVRYSETLKKDMLYIAAPIIKDNQIIGVLRLSISLESIKASFSNFWYLMITGLVILFILTAAIIYRVSDKITKPIEHITNIARRITDNDFTKRFKVKRNDEIGDLGLAINKMADSLEKQMRKIHENEKKLSTVLNHMASGVLLVDVNGRIILSNPALESLIGESAINLIGRIHSEVGHQDSISELINESFRTGKPIYKEVGIYYPTKKYLNSSIVPIFNDKGKIYGVLAVLHDITKIKHLENMRTEFVASVSHELRTPITAVKGFAETLLDGALTDEETSRSFLQIIYQESDRLHRLISDLLDLSKIELNQEILKPKKVNLKNLIESTLDSIKPQLHHRELEIAKNLDSIEANIDEDRIKQVIINLLANAISYTPDGGKITICLKEVENNQIKIEISDTGIGIPKKSLPRVFERFYRVDKARSRESGGTGLGLAIVKHIIESHNGSISVESEIEKGTTFTLFLPKDNNKKVIR